MKVNQQYLEGITETKIFSSENEIEVCNIASLVLPSFVDLTGKFDFKSFYIATKILVHNLNKISKLSTHPTQTASFGNLSYRPIGISVQGLADLFIDLKLPFNSNTARELNRYIAETLYHAALEASCEIAETTGPCHRFYDSPTSMGQLQFDIWGIDLQSLSFNWDALRFKIKRHGLANSLLVAYMPTTGTTQITGCSEACEPVMRHVYVSFSCSWFLMWIYSNFYTRRILSGESNVISTRLVECLEELQLWSPFMRDKILEDKGTFLLFGSQIPYLQYKALYKR